MPARQENRTIQDNEGNDHEYFVIQKPAMQGELLKMQLVKMIGPSIKQLKNLTIDNGKVDESKALEVFGEALSALFESTEPEKVVKWLQSLVIDVSRDKVRITTKNFDELYTDNMLEFYKVCAFVLEVNFANFFKGLNLSDALKKIAK